MDNNGFVIAPLVVRPVNKHDITLFPDSLNLLIDFSSLISMDLTGSFLTLDSGFYSEHNHRLIRSHGIIPMIKPNRGPTKDEKKIEAMYMNFNEQIYKQRFAIERTFAWQDTYRKLVVSYERLEATRLGFKYLGYSLINLRVFVGNTK